MEKEPLFLPAPFLMTRLPTLPIDLFYSLLNVPDSCSALFDLFDRDPRLREAIAIASTSLYEAIRNREKKTEKEKEQILSSLLKYALRMMTRATPFGLFSFVSTAYWGNEELPIDLRQVRKRGRPDMEWVGNVIDQLTANVSLVPDIPVKTNPLLFQVGDRLTLNYFRKTEQAGDQKSVFIRSSFLSQAILAIARAPIKLEHLVQKVIDQHPALVKEKVKGVVEKLLELQFLCPALAPSFLTTSPYSDFLNNIFPLPPSISDYPFLEGISQQLIQYSETPIGQGEELLCNLQAKMEKKVKAPVYLQVDAVIPQKSLAIPPQIGDDLGEVAEVLWQLTLEGKEQRPLSSYAVQFLEKYGTDRLVPLFELLSEEEGLGVPEEYGEQPKNGQKHPKERVWTNWLIKEWMGCLHEKEQEIVLSKEIIANLLDKKNSHEAPLSFDLNFEIVSDSYGQLVAGEYLLSISSHSWQGGSMLGRFVDLFDKEFKEQIGQFLEREEALEEALFADSSYMPSASRFGNVGIHPRMRRYAIDLGSNSQEQNLIPLSDILVGSTPQGLYLTLRDKPLELIVTSGSMLNPTFAPIPMRLIRDISLQRHQRIFPFSWKELENAPFLPRVRYKKCILSAAQWNVDLSQLAFNEKAGIKEIGQRFSLWADKWQLPRYLYLTEGDNRILFDRTHPLLIHELAAKLKKGTPLKLVEKLGQEKGEWIKSQEGKHLSEFVATFHKNRASSPAIPKRILSYTPVSTSDRWKLPGSEWLFAKLYIGKENVTRFLLNQLSRFVEASFQHQLIDEWFYVCYQEKQSFHLRVRFKVQKEKTAAHFLPFFHDWSTALLIDKFVKNVDLASYEREIERYGGMELIKGIESFFFIDSIVALSMLQQVASKKLDFPDYVLAALSTIDLLHGFGMNNEAQLTFLTPDEDDKRELKGFRNWKTLLTLLGKGILEEALPSLDREDATFLHEAFGKRKGIQNAINHKIGELQAKNTLTNSPFQIIHSLIHMHCNRLMGMDTTLEKKARLFAYQTVSTLLQAEQASSLVK